MLQTDAVDYRQTFVTRLKKMFRKLFQNPLSFIGFVVVMVLIIVAILAPILAPYPKDAGLVVRFTEAFRAPNRANLAGTDQFGRDILSRMLIGLRYSLAMALLVLVLSVPFAVFLGLLAGYYKDTIIETIIMRFTELFMAIPSLILAMVVCTMFGNSFLNSAVAIAVAWWPWYTRLAYSSAISVSNELYVLYSRLSGVKMLAILFKDILPNIIFPIITKMSLDMGSIIVVAASLNFVGLGIQPPAPSLGSMISEGLTYLPECWWISIMPSLLIVLVVLGFNLLGDGLNDLLTLERV